MMRHIKFFLFFFLLFPLFFLRAHCPSQTTVSGTSVTFVGELTDMGGDTITTVWFEYGPNNTTFPYKTEEQTRSNTGVYCIAVSSLSPCTTYYYRAAARNSGGTSYGETKNFTTSCSLNPSLDLKVNNSDGPLTLKPGEVASLHWNTSNVSSCVASGNWSGSKTLTGIEKTPPLSIGHYEYILTCSGSQGNVSDRVIVQVIGPAVAGAATAVPTGILKKNTLSSLFFSFFVGLSVFWFSKEKLTNFFKRKKN